jgi:alpha-glucoside transport system permease protein
MLFEGVAAFAVVVGVVLLLADFAPKRGREKIQVALFIGPPLLLVSIGLVVPAVRTSLMAFKDSFGDKWVGLENFQWMFTSPDARTVLINTAIWVVLTPFIATAVGLIYAILIDGSRFESVYKALVFLPMAISMVGASIIWKFMYEYRDAARPQIGLLNQILVWVGIDPYQFIITEPWNTFFLIFVMIWIQAGFAMTVLSAAIKSVPDDIVEAAQIDGATGFKLFRKVTVPTIRPAVVVVLTTIAMGSLKAFDIVRTMTGGNFGTSIVANEFYTQSFRQGEQGVGVGAALAVILFIIIIPVIVYNVRQMRLSEDVR